MPSLEHSAVIIGRESGIGRGTSEALTADGAAVFIGGALDEPGDTITGNGGAARFLRTDVRDPDAIARLINEAKAPADRLDPQVHCADVFGGFATCMETRDELRTQGISINLTGCSLRHGQQSRPGLHARSGRGNLPVDNELRQSRDRAAVGRMHFSLHDSSRSRFHHILRFALVGLAVSGFWVAVHYALAIRRIRQDTARLQACV